MKLTRTEALPFQSIEGSKTDLSGIPLRSKKPKYTEYITKISSQCLHSDFSVEI